MSYNITDFSELEIEITDTVRTWYIPKFRIYMVVDGDFCYLYWTDSEKVSTLSPGAEVFLVRLFMKADDHGGFHANPQILRAQLYPLKLDKVSGKDVIKLIGE